MASPPFSRGIARALLAASCCAWVGCGSFGSNDASPADGGGATQAGRTFCDDAPPARRCIDFERAGQTADKFGFDELFTDKDNAPAGTLALDSAFSASAPNSLRAETLQGGAAEADIVLQTAGALPKQLHLQMRVRYDVLNPGTSSSSHFVSLRCRTKPSNRVYLKVTAGGRLGLVQETGGIDPTAAPSFDISKWHAIDIVVDGGTTPNISVMLDDVNPFGGKLPLVPFTCSEAMVLRFGSWVSTGVGAYSFRFDDIVLDWN